MNDPRKEFLEAYVSLVGQVNRSLHSQPWWATDFSSKNRFNSRLPELVQKFLAFIAAPDSQPVPWQIRASLKKAGKDIPGNSDFIGPLKESVLEFCKRFIGGGYHFFRLLGRYVHSHFILRKKMAPVFCDSRPVYVIKTFVYEHSFSPDGKYRDIFFGQLPDFLNEKGERVIFLANVLGNWNVCLKRIAACPNAVIIPVDYFGSVSSILASVWVSWFYRPQIKEPVYFLKYEMSDLINAELVSCSGAIQPYQYLHHAQTKNFLKRNSVKYFLMTYENNPWEKMCIMALRQSSPQTKILGYQHTVTPQASVNMFISAEEEKVIPQPDCVLTVGAIPKEIIERYTQISSLPLKAACALRYENLWRLAPLPRTRTFKILLGLEGIFDVYKLVNYVFEQLEGNPKYKIVLRPHPVLPVSAISPKFVKKLEDLPFVEISRDRSVIADIERTDLTMYWGSTVSLESLWMGKPVIHFEMDTFLSYDPLFDCPDLKWTVNRRQKLTAVLEEIYSLSDENFFLGRAKAQEYLRKYFYPINPQNLAPFLT